ncbi:hypothetical protein HK105_206769 [Polyrhizophydium stewartii]|uniref:Ankyrin repeat protein n=1 Tax=Polyrhizophydium stewartii TaxID=2732419 RepID=A0ABR4N2M1_9FUNG
MEYAARSGQADVVEWLHKNRTEGILANTLRVAAQSGQLDVIQRIHTLAPALLAHLDADYCASNGQDRVLDWILDKTGGRPTKAGIWRAVKHGHVRMLPWFRKHMPQMHRSHSASRIGNRSADAAIDWFDREDLPTFPARVMQLAINERLILVIKWLLEHVGEDKWCDGDLERARELVGTA